MQRSGNRIVLIVALVAAIIGGVATYGVSALTNTAKTEVRITAQRLDDGRVEFALQEREDDGAWGERLLPARRFFPAQGFVNRWANSSPLEIDAGVPFYVNTTEPIRTLTIEELLDRCSNGESKNLFDRDGDGEIDQTTWGEYFAMVDEVVTELKSITPPPELAEYYAAQISAITVYAQYAFMQRADEQIDVWGFLVVGIVAGQLTQEAEHNLDPQIRQRLVEAGCIEPSGAGFAASGSGEAGGSG